MHMGTLGGKGLITSILDLCLIPAYYTIVLYQYLIPVFYTSVLYQYLVPVFYTSVLDEHSFYFTLICFHFLNRILQILLKWETIN